jgi:hypothetical protein
VSATPPDFEAGCNGEDVRIRDTEQNHEIAAAKV